MQYWREMECKVFMSPKGHSGGHLQQPLEHQNILSFNNWVGFFFFFGKNIQSCSTTSSFLILTFLWLGSPTHGTWLRSGKHLTVTSQTSSFKFKQTQPFSNLNPAFVSYPNFTWDSGLELQIVSSAHYISSIYPTTSLQLAFLNKSFIQKIWCLTKM